MKFLSQLKRRLKSVTYLLGIVMAAVSILRSGLYFYKSELFLQALLVMACREKTFYQVKKAERLQW